MDRALVTTDPPLIPAAGVVCFRDLRHVARDSRAVV